MDSLPRPRLPLVQAMAVAAKRVRLELVLITGRTGDRPVYPVHLCRPRLGLYNSRPFLFDGDGTLPLEHVSALPGRGYFLRIPDGQELKPSEAALCRWAIKKGWRFERTGSSAWREWQPPLENVRGDMEWPKPEDKAEVNV